MPTLIDIAHGKKVYFASDFHFGAPDPAQSRARERKVIRWLESVRPTAGHVFLLGDLFDFWCEYRTVVPRGFTRFLGTLAAFTDAGIPVTVFTGNHDLGMKGYFEEELGIAVHHSPQAYEMAGKRFLLGHGDGLGPGDPVYKTLKWLFENRFFQWLYRGIHPNLGIGLANYWSGLSRKKNTGTENGFLGDDEWLWAYSKAVEAKTHHDFYLFGHRHLPLDLPVGQNSRYVNLGEWINFCTYAVFDGSELTLNTFEVED